jgi:hypothetical protein
MTKRPGVKSISSKLLTSISKAIIEDNKSPRGGLSVLFLRGWTLTFKVPRGVAHSFL